MQSILQRTLRLGLVLATRPLEFVDRVAGLIDRLTDRPEGPTAPPIASDRLWPFMSRALNTDVSAILREPALAAADAWLAEQKRNTPPDAPFGIRNSAEELLGHVLYVLCRALRPVVVVETGVAYGSTTAYILTALETNTRGRLYSIDLPSIMDRNGTLVGRFVPERLRTRWSLHLGASRRVLPKLLSKVGPVGIFVHDSLHTYRNMLWEFATVTPHLGRPAAVVSDDAESNPAFESWARMSATSWAQVRQIERGGLLGVALLSPRS